MKKYVGKLIAFLFIVGIFSGSVILSVNAQGDYPVTESHYLGESKYVSSEVLPVSSSSELSLWNRLSFGIYDETDDSSDQSPFIWLICTSICCIGSFIIIAFAAAISLQKWKLKQNASRPHSQNSISSEK